MIETPAFPCGGTAFRVGDSAASRHDPLAPELGNGPPTLGRSLTSRFSSFLDRFLGH